MNNSYASLVKKARHKDKKEKEATALSEFVEVFGSQKWEILESIQVGDRAFEKTEAMYIPHIGCVVKHFSESINQTSEAMILVPNTRIKEVVDLEGKVVDRKLVAEREQ